MQSPTDLIHVEYTHLSHALIVPGLTGSRLNAQDSSSGPCDSNGESRNVWVNTTLFQQTPECFLTQLT